MALLTCPKCRALLEPETRRCPYCETDLRYTAAPGPSADADATGRVGLWILTTIVVLFFVMLVFDPAKGDQNRAFTPSEVAVDVYGESDWVLVDHCGQYWRFVTAIFLHRDLLHLIFNTVALMILTPLAAHTFGAHRTTCIFFLAGLVGSVASHLAGSNGVGASGALCGLVAAVGVYGKRRGGTEGRMLAQRMLMWAVIILVYGMFVRGVDNTAHLGGFVAGALFGQLAAGIRVRGGRVDRLWRFTAWACIVLAVAVGAIWMLPSVVRGYERRDVKLYESHVDRTLDRIARGTLPESFEDGPRGSDEVRDAVRRALAAAREKRSDVAALLSEARSVLREWEGEFVCNYGHRRQP